VDPAAARYVSLGPEPVEWDEDRVVLYHLGLGAGDRPADIEASTYVDEHRLRVLPTFAVVPSGQISARLLKHPTLAHRPENLLHMAQELVIHRPVPTSARVSATARVQSVAERGHAAQVAILVDLETAAGPLASTIFHLRLAGGGGGGFGGQRTPLVGGEPPPRPPTIVTHVRLLPQLAAIYRLSADRHPLHIDPAFATAAGYPAPLIAGLCTWGVVAKAVLDNAGGEPERLTTYRARFDGPVFPGETLEISSWGVGSRRQVRATVVERAAPALTGEIGLKV